MTMYAIAQTFTNARFFHKSHAIRTVLGEIGKLINQSVWRQMKTYDDTTYRNFLQLKKNQPHWMPPEVDAQGLPPPLCTPLITCQLVICVI